MEEFINKYALVFGGPVEFFGRIENDIYYYYETGCYQKEEKSTKFSGIGAEIEYIDKKTYIEILNNHKAMMSKFINLDDRRKDPSRLQIAEAIVEKDHVVDAIQQVCLKAIQKAKEDDDA